MELLIFLFQFLFLFLHQFLDLLLRYIHDKRDSPFCPCHRQFADSKPHTSTELPIALRNGTRSCFTHHPLSNYVSYHALSAPYSCFITNLSSSLNPTCLKDDLSRDGWRKAMEEECLPCLVMRHGILSPYLLI